MVPKIPILRLGQPYDSVENIELMHHATGEPVAVVSQANSGLIARDVRRMADDALERFPVAELLAMCRKAAELFANMTLPIGDGSQSFDDYLRQLSATTGMPITYCRNNAEKIRRVLSQMDVIVGGLTRGLPLDILDRGHGTHDGRTLSFFREGRILGAVLPSNSPGMHGLWLPAIALKAPLVLRPGREEPWTPLRIIEALSAAGVPREAFGFYPSDHAGASEILRVTPRSMLFGDTATTEPWQNDHRVQLHGPGFSKMLLGDDTADDWERYLDVIESSVAANCGRSCLNTSSIWTPRNGEAMAEALARRLTTVEALPADDPRATIAAFANPAMAERINAVIDNDLRVEGAADVTARFRVRSDNTTTAAGASSGRFVRRGLSAYLLPTIIWCKDPEHPLTNREFLFPYASVVECPVNQMPQAIGPTLVVSAITQDQSLIRALMESSNIDRLNIGPIPTWQISWDQPHEGNLFEHLYRQRAFQVETAA